LWKIDGQYLRSEEHRGANVLGREVGIGGQQVGVGRAFAELAEDELEKQRGVGA
jgi:hypothetical protein